MPALEFDLLPSRWGLFLYLSMLLISMVAILLLPISLGYQLLLAGLVASYGYLSRRHPVFRMRYVGNNRWQLQTQKGVDEGELMGSSTVTPFVSVLCFHVQGARLARSCVVFRDALAADQYRQLLVIWRMC